MDQLLSANDMSFAAFYFILFVSINLISILISYIASMLYIKLQNRLGYALNCDFIKIIQNSTIGAIESHDTAYLNQRINNDSNALIIFCISIVQSIIINTIVVIVSLCLLFSFHLILASILLFVALLYFIFYTLYKKKLYKVNHVYQESQSFFFGKLHEQLFNIKIIKLHGLYSQFIERLNQSFLPLLNNAFKRQRSSFIFGSFDQLVLITVQVVLLLLGGSEIIAGRLTIGRFVIILSYFNMMLGAVRYFFSMGETIQSNMVSYNRLKTLSYTKQESNGMRLINKIDSIELKHLSFSYGENLIFHDLNATFKKGCINFIRGSNGSGKSTLIDIILGLHTNNLRGEILYNGISIKNIDMRDSRRRLFGVSEQEPTLLPDTLFYNICLEDSSLSKERLSLLNKLISVLHLEEFIQSLPSQLLTTINDHSSNISGGEKQKIAILRALLKNPGVVILDEPTSALDDNSRESLKQYLYEIKDDKIIIIITHEKESELINNEPVFTL